MHNYISAYGTFPNGHVEQCPAGTAIQTETGCTYYTGWAIQILPFIEQDNVFATYNNNVPNYMIGFPTNGPTVQQIIKIFGCPSDPRANQVLAPETLAPNGQAQPTPNLLFATSSYRGMSGLQDTTGLNPAFAGSGLTDTYGGYWDEVQDAVKANPSGKGVLHGDGMSGLTAEKIAGITDGTSNTLLVGERHTRTHGTRAGFWGCTFNLYSLGAAQPVYPQALWPDYDACQAVINANYCKYGWGSLHSGGNIQFVFCDGSVHGISQNISLPVFCALSTVSGGEVIDLSQILN
jgi:prepilin-type processing-associated H-X9-DG protein